MVLWLPSVHWQVGAAAGLFVAVWAADLWLARHGLLPAWFVDLRTGISAAVVLAAEAAWPASAFAAVRASRAAGGGFGEAGEPALRARLALL